jgi:hypothetical protein
MSGLFAKPGNGAQQAKRLNGMQVQRSNFGAAIPIGWGRNRVPGLIVWYDGFKAHAVTTTQRSGGKGGSSSNSSTTYTYTASVIMVLGEGVIPTVRQVFRDQQIFPSLTEAGLSLATGTVGQAVWGYLTTNFPAAAIGYSELAYVYAADYSLTTNATLQNHSFEVDWAIQLSGKPDANPSVLLADFLQNTRYGVPQWLSSMTGDLTLFSNYCLANNLLLSPVLDQQISARDAIREWLMATNCWANWSDGTLKVGTYGDAAATGNGVTFTPDLTPLYDLDSDHFQPLANGDPVIWSERDPSSIYNSIQVEFSDRAKAYDPNIAKAIDLGDVDQFGSRPNTSPYTAHSLCDADIARHSAQLYLQRLLHVRGAYQFTVPQDFVLLDCGDYVTLTDPGLLLVRQLVRITKISEDASGNLAMEAEPVNGASSAALYNSDSSLGYRANYAVAPGCVESNLFLQSSGLETGSWTKMAGTVSANATTAPDGQSTADKFIPSTASTTHAFNQDVASVPGVAYVYAAYFKAASYGKAILRLFDGSETNGCDLYFDSATGAISSTTVTGTGVLKGSGVVSIGSGWYRAWISVLAPGATSMRGRVYLTDGSYNPTWAGNGTDGVYIWGQQIRPGTTLPAYAGTTARQGVPFIFNPPSVLTVNGSETWAAVASLDPNWGGAYVWTSIDSTNYQRQGQVLGRARYGEITNALPITMDPDSSSSLGVDLNISQGNLENATHADAAASTSLFALGNELLAYGAATLAGVNAYTLSYLRRGALTTTVSAHALGASFVRLDEAIFKFPFLSTQAGQTVYVKFQSYNIYGQAAQDLSACAAYTVVPTSISTPAPTTSEWVGTGTTFTSGPSSIPGIVVTGACKNADATQLHLYFRVNGVANYSSQGTYAPSAIRMEITGLTDSTAYDLAISYTVAGVEGPLLAIGTVTSGIHAAPTGGPASGTTLLSTDTPGSGSFTVPSGVTSITAQRWAGGGYGGDSTNTGTDKDPVYTPGGGGGGGEYISDVISVTAGYVLTFSVGGQSSNTTFTGYGTAHAGGNGTTSTSGAGGSGGTGGTHTNGTSGGATNAWDGGGAGNGSGNQTTVAGSGTVPGGGGAGGSGGGANGRVTIKVT